MRPPPIQFPIGEPGSRPGQSSRSRGTDRSRPRSRRGPATGVCPGAPPRAAQVRRVHAGPGAATRHAPCLSVRSRSPDPVARAAQASPAFARTFRQGSIGGAGRRACRARSCVAGPAPEAAFSLHRLVIGDPHAHPTSRSDISASPFSPGPGFRTLRPVSGSGCARNCRWTGSAGIACGTAGGNHQGRLLQRYQALCHRDIRFTVPCSHRQCVRRTEPNQTELSRQPNRYATGQR